MAYATTNPPCKIAGLPGKSLWWYTSVDPTATVDDAGYFTNGSDLGMKVGDVVMSSDSVTPSLFFHRVSAVTAGGAATTIAMPLA